MMGLSANMKMAIIYVDENMENIITTIIGPILEYRAVLWFSQLRKGKRQTGKRCDVILQYNYVTGYFR